MFKFKTCAISDNFCNQCDTLKKTFGVNPGLTLIHFQTAGVYNLFNFNICLPTLRNLTVNKRKYYYYIISRIHDFKKILQGIYYDITHVCMFQVSME